MLRIRYSQLNRLKGGKKVFLAFQGQIPIELFELMDNRFTDILLIHIPATGLQNTDHFILVGIFHDRMLGYGCGIIKEIDCLHRMVHIIIAKVGNDVLEFPRSFDIKGF